MRRSVFVIILAVMHLTGCVAVPSPTPTVTPIATLQSPTATLRPTVVLPELPTAAPPTAAPTAAIPTDTPTTVGPTATRIAPPRDATAATTIAPSPTPTRPPTTRPAVAAATATSPATLIGWRAEYFANPDLHGQPTLVRTDRELDFDWGVGSPDPALPADHFSVRWQRAVTLPAGRWRFHAAVDDGVRVYVDGLPIIDRWHTSALVTYNTSLVLSGGIHLLRVDYYDDTGPARVRVWWETDDGSPTDPAHAGAWRGDYFGNRDLSGSPAFSRDDPAVYFDWGDGGPGGGIGGQDFSVRWTRYTFFGGGRYRFKARADDGVRVWFDWAAIIDQWHNSAGSVTYTRELDVANGNHTVVVEYYQAGGTAAVQVSWEPTNVEWVGNLHTCLLEQDSWIKVYRLAPNNRWEDLRPEGYGPSAAGGQLDLFGLPIDASYGWDGQPYRVELWIKGRLVRSEGNIFAGEPALRIMPGTDVRTSWPCGAALPRE